MVCADVMTYCKARANRALAAAEFFVISCIPTV